MQICIVFCTLALVADLFGKLDGAISAVCITALTGMLGGNILLDHQSIRYGLQSSTEEETKSVMNSSPPDPK